MRDYAGQELFADSGEGEEAVVNGELDFADDVELVAKEEVVVPVDRAAEGILHRENGSISDPELHGLESHLELVARNGFAVRIRLTGCRLRVCSGNALVRHAQLGAVHWSGSEVRNSKRFRRKRLVIVTTFQITDVDKVEIRHGGLVAVDGGDMFGGAAVLVGGGLLLIDDLTG